MYSTHAQEAFDKQIEGDGFVGAPPSPSTLTEDDAVVVAEGTVRVQRKDRTFCTLHSAKCYEMQGGKIGGWSAT